MSLIILTQSIFAQLQPETLLVQIWVIMATLTPIMEQLA
jgi:hypothetical protein